MEFAILKNSFSKEFEDYPNSEMHRDFTKNKNIQSKVHSNLRLTNRSKSILYIREN